MIVRHGIKKVLEGVIKYQTELKSELLPMFREILDKPAPKSIIVSCVDSCVIASRLFRAEPGAYFMIRNPGNFIPKYENPDDGNDSCVPGNVAASFELACVINNADTIAVVGQSSSKTIDLLYSMRHNIGENAYQDGSELKKWLWINGRDTIEKFKEFEESNFRKVLTFSKCETNQFEAIIDPQNCFEPKDKFSQINALEQLKNIKNYSFLKGKMNKNKIKGHALWLDVKKSDVYLFSYIDKMFIKIDDTTYEKLYRESDLD